MAPTSKNPCSIPAKETPPATLTPLTTTTVGRGSRPLTVTKRAGPGKLQRRGVERRTSTLRRAGGRGSLPFTAKFSTSELHQRQGERDKGVLLHLLGDSPEAPGRTRMSPNQAKPGAPFSGRPKLAGRHE